MSEGDSWVVLQTRYYMNRHCVQSLSMNRIDRTLNGASCLRVWNADQEKEITSFLAHSTLKQRRLGELRKTKWYRLVKMISVAALSIVHLQHRPSINTYYLSVSPDSDTRNQYLKLLYCFILCIYVYTYHKELYWVF